MSQKAVIDRFEEYKAVLLVGDGEQQMVVDRTLLPAEAAEGDWLQVDIADGRLVLAAMDPDETEARRQRIADKLAALRRGDQLR